MDILSIKSQTFILFNQVHCFKFYMNSKYNSLTWKRMNFLFTWSRNHNLLSCTGHFCGIAQFAILSSYVYERAVFLGSFLEYLWARTLPLTKLLIVFNPFQNFMPAIWIGQESQTSCFVHRRIVMLRKKCLYKCLAS